MEAKPIALRAPRAAENHIIRISCAHFAASCPNAQLTASTILDLPQPLGPTIAVILIQYQS